MEKSVVEQTKETPEHCDLVKQVLEVFRIEPAQYKIAAANNNEWAKQLLASAGFNVVQQEEASANHGKLNIDLFETYKGTRKSGTRTEYGVLNLSRNDHGVIRNSHELAEGFLVFE